MADEYLVTLAVGIGLLVILLIISNLTFVTKPETRLETASRVIELGDFRATFVKETVVHQLGNKEISNGLFFGETKVRYHFEAPQIESAIIQFRVARSNDLGPLFVKVNGRVVEQKNYAAGVYTINVPEEFLNESMTVEISALSSLWQIWAPNIYDLRDIKITTKAFSYNPAITEFDLAEEFLTFREARIELNLEENTGRVAVLVNEKELFSDYARNQQSVLLGKSDVKIGRNVLEIVPSLNSRFLGTARVVVFYDIEVKK